MADFYDKIKNNEQEESDDNENNENNENDENEQSEQTEQIIQTGIVAPNNAKHNIHCLTVIGQVEGHYILPPQNKTTKYEHIIPALVAIEQDLTIEGLVIILNTVGGDVEAGLAIAELIAGMTTPTVSIVVGGGHSIGVPLAVSAKKSFIVPSATMTIHPVRMTGLVLGIPQTFSYFDKMQDRIVNFVTKNSRITDDRFRELMLNTGELVMDVGSVLDGENAVNEGLIDSLGGLSDAINCLYELIEEHKCDCGDGCCCKKDSEDADKKHDHKKEEPAEKKPRGRKKKNNPDDHTDGREKALTTERSLKDLADKGGDVNYTPFHCE